MTDAEYDYRPVPDADVEAFRRLVTYAFRPTERPDPLDGPDDLPAPARIGARRGIYDGDELCCTGRHHWFTHRIRGERHAVGYLSVEEAARFGRLDASAEARETLSALFPPEETVLREGF
ncbi:GNAT family N-acetyltransferase [Halomarina halobia]|uniref:GNAT family N-acetyltransferase n=1 Tax=Halomarina halobia TaxID=3033386 RepID=A0ABD6A7E1_9EURY|nr:GNAT family N-acetyltransferase [Halomarina sp. PSR21]